MISTTYNNLKTQVEVAFGSGTVKRVFCKDILQIGPKQEFSEIKNKIKLLVWLIINIRILGLSFPELFSVKFTPLFDYIIK